MGKAPDFWWKPHVSVAALALAPVSWVYGLIAGRRMLQRPKAKSTLPVICIGNFVVGGTGKTPFALQLADRLKTEGHKPAFLLRGYGGRLKGPIAVDPSKHTAADVGDEALLLAKFAPTVIAADRPAGAAFLEKLPVDLILMDDGFQNPSLHKDLSLVLIDCAVGFGNGLCLPAGPLRAPAQKQILKTDCLVLIGEGDRAEAAAHLAGRRALPILHAQITVEENPALEGVKLLAYAGIGRPQKFFKSLKDKGYKVAATRSFADHHEFSEADARALITQAERDGLQLVTTAKDMARLETQKGEIFHWLAARSEVLHVRMDIPDEDRLIGLIKDCLRNRTFKT
ncbi:tetraacyldisaccharide 4'-kinase [Roseibium sp.]|uniref:tetraacyldisaccharide 4'-kinase n=1 Tax=Roseibium sp. TaxID=1936156 RepID=UPI003B518544